MWWFRRSRITLAVAALCLSACGFQLQGARSFPPVLETVYVSAADRYTGFHRALVSGLEQRGVRVTEDPAEARSIVDISQDETGRRVLSVSARNVPREFEVYYTVAYSVRSAEATLLDTQRITLTRDYTWVETQVLGKEREEVILRRALIDDIVRQVLRQLASIS